jgi:hypothetical protein
VYKGVIPDFADHVSQLAMGLCVALEVRAENAVRTFRETAGPWDVEMAKVGPVWQCCYVMNLCVLSARYVAGSSRHLLVGCD